MKSSPRIWRSLVPVLLHGGLLVALLVLVVWPVGMVLHAAWQGRGEAEPGLTPVTQRASLAIQTLSLVGETLLMALPVGVATALVVFRSNVPGRTWWAMLLLLPALVPLDLHATAWLAALGPQGLAKSLHLPIELKGLFGAAWVHAMASIPWVVALVGAAVSIVEAELEEDCLLIVGPIRTMWHVTLRRSAGAIVAAGLLVAVMTAGEMAVTDLLQVRTYAETIYTEFALASRVGVATATAVPGLAVWFVLVAFSGVWVARRVPQDSQALFARRPVFRLGSLRWPSVAGCAVVVLATLGVPAVSLAWRTGLKYPKRVASASDPKPGAGPTEQKQTAAADAAGPRWSPAEFALNLWDSWKAAGPQLILSLKIAVATAAVTVPFAWLLAASARQSRGGQVLAAAVACALFALPGPVLGIGLSLALNRPTAWWGGESESMGSQVADGLAQVADSWAVLVWLHCLRTLPFALAVLWPVVRLVNRSLLEAAAIDGAGAWRRFWHVELPACRSAVFAAALVCVVLSIGELSGSVMLTPPGLQPLSVRIFTLAHYGVENHLAGICLVLLGVASAGSLAVLLSLRWTVRSLEES